jgi:cobalt-zinc-cadmium efflux system membrane fusion protein
MSIKKAGPVAHFLSFFITIFSIFYCIHCTWAGENVRLPLKNMTLWGKAIVAANKEVHVYPRYAGIAKEILVREGNKVKKGDTLAKIESNAGLQTYSLVSPMDGLVAKKSLTLGEFVKEDQELFLVIDNGDIKVKLNVRQNELSFLSLGQEVFVFNADQAVGPSIKGKISYISPMLDEKTRSATVLVDLDSNNRPMLPGQQVFVKTEAK